MNISSIDWDPSDVASSSRKTSTVRIRGWRPSTQTPSVMMGGTVCLLPYPFRRCDSSFTVVLVQYFFQYVAHEGDKHNLSDLKDRNLHCIIQTSESHFTVTWVG